MLALQHANWQPQHDDEHSSRHGDDGVAHPRNLPFSHGHAAADERPSFGSTQILTARFARSLALKQTRIEQIVASRAERETRSKNCVSERKLAKRRLEKLRRRENVELRASIAQMQLKIASLERTRSLVDSHLLLWRTNRTGAVIQVCREYFVQFAGGYSSTTPQRALRQDSTRNFVYSVAEEDLLCREYRGIDKFLEQWEIYTKYHSDFRCQLRHLTLAGEDDNVVSVHCQAELDLEISDLTLQNLYPDFYAHAQQNPKSKEIAEHLVGKRYIMAFDKVLHFNRHGKLFAHESKVHLASSLLGLLEDPFAAMEVLEGSAMTVDGHWKTAGVDYMRVEQEEMHDIPRQIL